MARELTEKQQAFLNVLFEEAGGDMVVAKKMAGYADTSSTCLLYTSPSPRDVEESRMPSSA